MLKGAYVEDRIIGVDRRVPHGRARGPAVILAAVEEMEAKFPDTGGTLFNKAEATTSPCTFSPALVDFFIVGVAAGDKIPRKDGPEYRQVTIS